MEGLRPLYKCPHILKYVSEKIQEDETGVQVQEDETGVKVQEDKTGV